MNVLRLAMNWLAPSFLVFLGGGGLLSLTGLLGAKREQASLVIDDPWWITGPLCAGLVLLGAFRLRQIHRPHGRR